MLFGFKLGRACYRRGLDKTFYSEYCKKRDNLLEQDVEGRIVLKLKLKCERGIIWSGFLRFKIGSSGRLL
jgi:hypothetical protein